MSSAVWDVLTLASFFSFLFDYRKPCVVGETDLLMEGRPWRVSIKVQGSQMGNGGPFISRAQKPIVARFRVKCVFCVAPSPCYGDEAAPAIMTQSVPLLLFLFLEMRERPPLLFSPVSSLNDTKDDFAVILCKILRNGQCDYFCRRCIIIFFFSAAMLDLMSVFWDCKLIRRLLHVSTSEFSTECYWTEQSDAHQEGHKEKNQAQPLCLSGLLLVQKKRVRGKRTVLTTAARRSVSLQ